MDLSKQKIMGYRRENGRVGVRNHVILLPLDDLSNAACLAVENHVKGTLALPHHYGRLQFGADLELHFRTLIGIGSNPNVAAVVVIGIEPEWTRVITDGIAKTGKPVFGFSIEQNGDINTVAAASRKAKELVQWATGLQREECMVKELMVSCKCGESDTTSGIAANPTVGNAFDKLYENGNTLLFGETSEITGGEHLVAQRCRTPEIAAQFMKMWSDYNDFIIANKTNDLSDSQPTKGNILGGLTTIEEKALGAIKKGGTKPLVEVLEEGERPTKKGFVIMDAPAPGVENLTAIVSGGCHAVIFSTGKGNCIGHPVAPVIKISGNPMTVKSMRDNIDVDVSGVINQGLTLDQATDIVQDKLADVCWGAMTSSDMLGEIETAASRLLRTL